MKDVGVIQYVTVTFLVFVWELSNKSISVKHAQFIGKGGYISQ